MLVFSRSQRITVTTTIWSKIQAIAMAAAGTKSYIQWSASLVLRYKTTTIIITVT